MSCIINFSKAQITVSAAELISMDLIFITSTQILKPSFLDIHDT